METLSLKYCLLYPQAKLSGSKSLLNQSWTIAERLCNDDFPFATLKDCKLVLRPMSDLLKDEKKFIEHNFNYNFQLDWQKINGNYFQLQYLIEHHYLKETIDYLRSINIYLWDLPEGTYILEPRKAVAE